MRSRRFAVNEPDAVVTRYAMRIDADARYSLLRPEVLLAVQERERAIAALYRRLGWQDLSARRLVEVGCGAGGNLVEALRFGFQAQHLTGIELLPERCALARAALPPAVRLIEGDASLAELPPAQADVVLASTVFSSLLDDAFQRQVAAAMWHWLRPGGGVLGYDFTVDNPRNRDVRGVPLKRWQALFPQGRLQSQRLTLAPPLARAAARLHPVLVVALNRLPLLRTHRLVWIEKVS
jgi:SAM-dependent methyltransferase